MPEMIRLLEPSDIAYGKLYLGGLKDHLPAPSEPIHVVDSDGEKFVTKMHSSMLRMDGLTALLNKHRSRPGQAVRITVRPREPGIVHVSFYLHADDADHDHADDGKGYIPEGADRRPVVERQIRARRGQQAFRDALRQRYGHRCLVTRCNVLAVLEAAHINPYRGENDNHVENGLLLRADIHTLFDLDLIGVEPDNLRVDLDPVLVGEYGFLAGRTLCCAGQDRPSHEALLGRYERFRAVSQPTSTARPCVVL